MAIASLVLGIVSCVIAAFFALAFGWVGVLVGVVGIVLGVLARKNPQTAGGMATAGLVCSIIGTVLSLALYVACMACAGGTAAMFR